MDLMRDHVDNNVLEELHTEQKRHGTVAHIMNRIYELQLEQKRLIDKMDIKPNELESRFGELMDLYESEAYVALEEEEMGVNHAFSAILPFVPLYVYTGECESLAEACAEDGKVLFSGQEDDSEIVVFAGEEFDDADYAEIRLEELFEIMKRLGRPACLYHLCAPCGDIPRYCFELDEATVMTILKGELMLHPIFVPLGSLDEPPVERDIKFDV